MRKDDVRVWAYGEVDELNAVLGWCVTQLSDERLRGRVELLQHDLFTLGAALATPAPRERRQRPETPELPVSRVAEMEGWIDAAADELTEIRAFIVPGGGAGAAALHVARTVCRRAERAVVRLAAEESVADEIVTYLNRLSDVLFVFARLENHRRGHPDVEWRKP